MYLRNWCVCLALLLAVVLVYGQVGHFPFIGYDDPDYVTENAHVRGGLTWSAVQWAFTTADTANWIPLTWLSHMAVCALFALEAGAHHCANVCLHLLGAMLLFAALKRMTGAHWRSALVAFLFAVHPLHVESVAWISERKDVLSALFWFLSLWLYAGYAERTGIRRYLAVLASFACGLMAKPMLVTLPFVLLLLDVWPLGRFRKGPPARGIFLEKVPFLVLAAAASAVAYAVQLRAGAVSLLTAIPFSGRLANALVSYAVYFARTFWPARLAVFYPFAAVPAWEGIAAGLFVAAVCAAVLRLARSRPYLAVGWFWFLGTLVPVIGLVQVGAQARADRYLYLPMTGILIAVAWGFGELASQKPSLRPALCALAAAGCAACLPLAWLQVNLWRDDATLFRHAIEVTDGNYLAYNNLGLAQRKQGQIEAAIADYQQALRIRPDFPGALMNLGEVYTVQNRPADAVVCLREAARLSPSNAEIRTNLANALSEAGNQSEAEPEYREAIRLQPERADAHAGLAAVLAAKRHADESVREFQEALRLRPDDADAHFNLGQLLAAVGRPEDALGEFAEAVRLRPDDADAHRAFGVALAEQGSLNKALEEFQACVRLRPDDAHYRFNLATALSYLQRNDEALAQLAEALRIRPDFPEALGARKYLLGLRAAGR